ncbi:MAG TPA: tetratricopeptide repeat protein, partial [Candidatus Melainabacteria bacterium]|nr:tetratricopeptide repeat protein [Candidatus Melainabacteria bacterium]
MTIFLVVIVRQRFEYERIQRETLIKELKELAGSRDSFDFAKTIGTIERIVEGQKQQVESQLNRLSEEGIKAIPDNRTNSDNDELLKKLELLLRQNAPEDKSDTREEIAEIKGTLLQLKSKFEEMAAVDKFVALLDDEEEKRSALISAIRRLGNDEIAIRLAVAYPSSGATSILQDIAISGKGNELVGWALEGIADSHRANGDLEKAEIYYKQSLVALENSLGDEHEDVAEIIDALAQIALKQGRPVEAEEFLERSNSIREKLHGTETAEVADSSIKLADLYSEQGKLQ